MLVMMQSSVSTMFVASRRPPEPGFPDDPINLLTREIPKRQAGHHFKKGGGGFGRLAESGLHRSHPAREIGFGDRLAVDLNPLANTDQVRRSIETHPKFRRAQARLTKGRGRTLAVCPGQVDETQPVLRTPQRRGEFPHWLQSQFHPEAAGLAQIGQRLGIGHCVGRSAVSGSWQR